MSGRLTVEHPPGYAPERAYIHDVLLREFLGLEYQVVCADRRDIRVTLNGDSSERELTIADVLFQTPEKDWLTQSSMPVSPGKEWWDAGHIFPDVRLLQKPVPVIYGQPEESSRASEDSINLNLDIFGSAFFMLTRYEEVVVQQRDEHGRFSAQPSFAGMAGVLDRPVINEYLEILWHALSSLWPSLERRQRQYSVALSHDVDWPLCTAGRPAYRAARTVAADVVNRKSPGIALRRAKGHVQSMRGCPDGDLCNTFDFIMDHSERRGLTSAFNFIAGRSAGDIDGCYSLDDPWIRGLIGRVSRRGHEIGLHPSYNSYDNPALTRHEYEKLRRVTDDLGIEQERWGGRQHYLRWECPTTWQNWEDAGLDYDSTLSFSDVAGFRCGVCYDYPVFNVQTRERLKLREHPLIAMEVTLTGYMGLTWDGARQAIHDLSNVCRAYDGEFTLLWHNNFLVSDVERRAYAAVLEAVGGNVVQELLVQRPQLPLGIVLVAGLLAAALSTFAPLMSVMMIAAALLLLVVGLSRSLILAITVMSGTADLLTSASVGPVSSMGMLTILYAGGTWAMWMLRPRWTPQRAPTILPLALLLGWGVVGMLLWYTPTVNGMQNLLSLTAFLGIIVLSARDNRDGTIDPKTFGRVFDLAMAMASGFYIISQVAGPIAGFSVGVRTYALLALVGLSWYVADWRCGSRRSLWIALAILALLVLSLSRTALVLGIFLFPLAHLRLNNLVGWLKLAVLGTLSLAVLYAGISYFEPLRSRFFEGDTSLQVAGISINAEGRVNAWEAVLDSHRESPWIGKGVGSSEEVVKARFESLSHPHNDYLRILHDYGFLGLGLWLVGYGGLLRVTWRAWLAADDSGDKRGRVHLAAFLALVAAGLAMLTDNVVVYVFVMAPLGVLVGASLGTMGSVSSETTGKPEAESPLESPHVHLPQTRMNQR